MSDRPENPIGTLSTVLALGQTQLSAPRSELPAANTLASPARRYATLELLGQGGMGVVHRIWDGDLMRELALKRMRPELREDPRLAAQFLWEARVTAYLDHPNIVPVHDLGCGPDGELYFTMKKAQGTPLDVALERLKAGDAELAEKLPLARRLRVIEQICSAVAFAHGRGVLHRDLKPANVVLGEHGEVLVMDWGLAIPLPGPEGERIRAVMPEGIEALSAGTPLYMSPEQARGDALDGRSDVFTLGVMLYELATLARPFEGSSVVEVTRRVAAGELRPLREVWPEAPAPLAAVVERALQRDPAQRYPSSAALAEDLQRVLDGRTPLAEHPSTLTRASRFYLGRDPGLAALRVVDFDLWVCGGVFLGVAIGLAIFRWVSEAWPIAAAASLVLAVTMATPPTRRWLRSRRQDQARRS